MFSLPDNFLASTSAFLSQGFSDFKPLIILIFALAIFFWMMPKLIDLLKHILGK